MCLQTAEDSGKDPEATFAEYCDKVEKSAAWGGQLELKALAGAYERHITVYSVGMPPVEMGKEFEGAWRSSAVCQALIARCDEQLLQSTRACERHITVYSVGMPPVEVGEEFEGARGKLVGISGLDVLYPLCTRAATVDSCSSLLLLPKPGMHAPYPQQHDLFTFRRSPRDCSCVKLCVCVCRSTRRTGALAAMLLEACLWPGRALQQRESR